MIDGSNRSMVLALTCIAQFMVILDLTIVNVALPAIQGEYDVGRNVLQWVVIAYGPLLGGFLLLGGRMSDLLGRRRIFLIGSTIFGLASLVAGISPSPELLIGAHEVAGTLGISVASVNSALQRARASVRLQREAAPVSSNHLSVDEETERHLVQRLITAWHAADIDALVSILSKDAVLSMPPVPDRYVGPDAIRAFLSTVPANGRLDRFRMVPIRANRQPALAAYYREGDEGAFTAHAIIVLSIAGEAISSIVRFNDEHLFRRFQLPPTLAEGNHG